MTHRPTEQTHIDMHVKVLDDQVVRRAKSIGLDAIVYAPHFTRLPTIERQAARHSDEELLVIPAREIFTGDWRTRRHLLAIGLSDPVPDFITMEGALAELDRQDAAVLIPHPEFLNVSLSRPEITAHAARIDAVETYNAKLFPHQNWRAQRIARDLDIPAFGSSYAHLTRTVGEVWTTFETSIETPGELVDAIRSGTDRRVFRRSGIDHHVSGAIEFGHLAYENSWKKFDRLLLSGQEPTHPENLLYSGRFDRVSVY